MFSHVTMLRGFMLAKQSFRATMNFYFKTALTLLLEMLNCYNIKRKNCIFYIL